MTGRELIRLQATLHGHPARARARARRRAARAGRPRRTPPTAASAPTRAGCSGGSTSPRRSSTSRACSSSTSRPPASTRSAARRSGRRCATLNDEGTTVFLTTQYLEEADQLADNVGIIDSGRIVAEGTPESLKAEIGNPHIELQLADGSVAEAERGLRAASASCCRRKDGKTVLVEVEHGAADIAPVVRALDEAGIAVESLELVAADPRRRLRRQDRLPPRGRGRARRRRARSRSSRRERRWRPTCGWSARSACARSARPSAARS